MKFRIYVILGVILTVSILALSNTSFAANSNDIVILNGRIIDSESNLDSVYNIAINKGIIQTITSEPIKGKETIDAKGLIVSPGFIDLHVHLDRQGRDELNFSVKAMDGVTTALDLEGGALDIDDWYKKREGKAIINYGVSVGSMEVRKKVMKDKSETLPTGDAAHRAATESELKEIIDLTENGLKRGAIGVGLTIQYTPASTKEEILEIFRVAANFNSPCIVHLRYFGIMEPTNSINALQEVIDGTEKMGAPLHVCHISSMGLKDTPKLFEMISEARSRGLDVTTECYPYTAAATGIQSALFDKGWQQMIGIEYQDLEWAATGKRLTEKTFEQYRKKGGLVIAHVMSEEVVETAVTHPLTVIASDSILFQNKKGHPRSSGTFSRVLGHYVREKKKLTWTEALRKMTLMPAQRIETRVPIMKNKGRIRTGADADITIFDPEKVTDKATFKKPAEYSEGIEYVIVNGVLVVKKGKLQRGPNPGHPIRAPIE